MKIFLTLTCPDRIGIIYKITEFLANNKCNIIENSQWTDLSNNTFFIRIAMDSPLDHLLLNDMFKLVALNYDMNYNFYPDRKTNTIILVSKFDHCLTDLLYRYKKNLLNINIDAIISNHQDVEDIVKWHNIPFYYIPFNSEHESQIRNIIDRYNIDLIILARYMRILSNKFCQTYYGKIINIHHSFLPSFKGAMPYYQAWEKGVKLIGATAHFVTADLDMGPIIEQSVERVDHTYSTDKLIAVGRDIETIVLAKATQYYTEHRIFINDNKTVVFR